MPTFQRCDKSVNEMASQITRQYDTHQPLIDAKVVVDFVFTRADQDDNGDALGYAIVKNGHRCLGLCRNIPLKDRALGRGDAEVTLDGDWWDGADDRERRALLDHELNHIAIKIDKRGLVTDDLGRPVLQLRKHDIQVGWFKVIAERHGKSSQECKQAADIMDVYGQFLLPGITQETTSGSRMQNLEVER